MSQALRYLSATIDNEELTGELRLRACSAMAANAGVYRQLLESAEIAEMAERLAALEAEAQVEEATNGHHQRRY